jgi:hypothetical protein
MKALPKRLLPLTLFGIAVTSLFCVQPAQAGYMVTLQQVGPNVVATGSGPIDLSGLIFLVGFNGGPFLDPNSGQIASGAMAPGDIYRGAITGPSSFGSGDVTLASSGTGDAVGIVPSNFLLTVPDNYVSGNALSDSSTYNNATFASLGATPGTYVWTWGTGANQNFTLQIGAGVPDAGSTLPLLGFALLGVAVLRRKLRC